ncbi:hypothetical protein CROQUDRAFT_531947 [Cronartium quercuum f. sp. fusiforme G11]|uniref:Uncharacterized protein n=1 Tax=Cronartium quercuum f. sp. fusiforme G11 TaxID=708437 RepID=A0A9P6NG24_9BASI|nr:hypothetical protein CROQUDRAFT_531947 [Cronartium quercuum f. sp. fusiforme G11]
MPTVNTNSNHIIHFFLSHSKHSSLGNQPLPKESASILYPHPIMPPISKPLNPDRKECELSQYFLRNFFFLTSPEQFSF